MIHHAINVNQEVHENLPDNKKWITVVGSVFKRD